MPEPHLLSSNELLISYRCKPLMQPTVYSLSAFCPVTMPATGLLLNCLHQLLTATMHTVCVTCPMFWQSPLKAFREAAFLQPLRHRSVSTVFRSSHSSRGR